MVLFSLFSDDKDKPLCAPFMKIKPAKSDGEVSSPNLTSIQANIESGQYETVTQFDADMNAVFSVVWREHGRVSTLGNVAVQLKKVEYVQSKTARTITSIYKIGVSQCRGHGRVFVNTKLCDAAKIRIL